MAELYFNDLGGLIDDLEELWELPAYVKADMLAAEAAVVAQAQKNEIASLGLVNSGQLMDSIKQGKTTSTEDGMCTTVYPQGKRENGVRNAEVGFILEWGAPNKEIKGANWMKNANDKCIDEAVAAAEKVYHNYLDKLNL